MWGLSFRLRLEQHEEYLSDPVSSESNVQLND